MFSMAADATTAGGTTLQEGAPYWSSSEVSSGFAYGVILNGTAYWGNDSKVDDHRVRACLAF